MKTLGFGFMHLPLLDSQDEGSIDFSTLQSLVDEYLARGFSHFDTGWMYCKEQSEPAIKKVLTDRYPRSAFSVTTKLPPYLLHSKSDRDKIFLNSVVEQAYLISIAICCTTSTQAQFNNLKNMIVFHGCRR